VQGVVVVDDHRFDEQRFALQEELAAGLGGGDRCGGHQFGDLADGVGAEGVVVEVFGHAGAVTCWADQA
jgi:hypothetical protein